MPWNLGSTTISRVWQFVDQFTAGQRINRSDHDTALNDVVAGVNDAIAYLITQIEIAASSELYLGTKASAPTLNNEGEALVAGNLYMKSPEYVLYVWSGAAWIMEGQFGAASTYFKSLVAAEDAAALRALLGLGTAATFASTSFATPGDIDDLNLGDASTLDEATSAQYRNNTADKLLSTDQTWGAMAEVTLTDGASIALNLSTGLDFTVTLGGNRTLANPTNAKVGQRGRIRVVQDGTGSRTLSYGTSYKFARGIAPTLTTTAGREDILQYDVISPTKIAISILPDLSS